MGNRKGDKSERELRDLLLEEGFAVVRAAGSGSAPGVDLPDLHVSDGGYEWAVEVKRKKGHRNEYLEPEEVESLLVYSSLFRNAKPRVAARWDRDTTWYFADPRELPETDAGARRLDPDAMDEDPWTTLDDLLDLPECEECGDMIYPSDPLGPVARSEETGGGVVHGRCVFAEVKRNLTGDGLTLDP